MLSAAPPDPGPSAEGLEEGEGSKATPGESGVQAKRMFPPSLPALSSPRAHSRRGQVTSQKWSMGRHPLLVGGIKEDLILCS